MCPMKQKNIYIYRSTERNVNHHTTEGRPSSFVLPLLDVKIDHDMVLSLLRRAAVAAAVVVVAVGIFVLSRVGHSHCVSTRISHNEHRIHGSTILQIDIVIGIKNNSIYYGRDEHMIIIERYTSRYREIVDLASTGLSCISFQGLAMSNDASRSARRFIDGHIHTHIYIYIYHEEYFYDIG
jgi:hypothetical protein